MKEKGINERDFIERYKTVVLIILIALSLVQSVLLWNQLNKGMTASAFAKVEGSWLTDTEFDLNIASEELFSPFWMCVPEFSEEENQDNYVQIGVNSREFEVIWKGVYARLMDLFTGTKEYEKSVEVVTEDEYNAAVENSVLICSFVTNMKNSVITALTDKKASKRWTEIITGVQQIVYAAGDGVDTPSMYLTDYDNYIKISLKDKNLSELKNLNKLTSKELAYKQLVIGGSPVYNFPVSKGGGSDYYYEAEFKIPGLINFNPSIPGDRDRVAGILFGSDKAVFESDVSSKGAALYRNESYILSLQVDGYMEYIYQRPFVKPLGDFSDDDMEAAFKNALRFIYASRLRDIGWNGSMYISGIELTEQGFFRFSFDYRLKDGRGTPVYISREGSSAAVVIEAVPSRVLSCKWFLLNYSLKGQKILKEFIYNDEHIKEETENALLMYHSTGKGEIERPVVDYAGYCYFLQKNGLENPKSILKISSIGNGNCTIFKLAEKDGIIY